MRFDIFSAILNETKIYKNNDLTLSIVLKSFQQERQGIKNNLVYMQKALYIYKRKF